MSSTNFYYIIIKQIAIFRLLKEQKKNSIEKNVFKDVMKTYILA